MSAQQIEIPGQPRIGQVNSALGLMGPTGAGKSSLIATAAEYAYETFKVRTLLYSFSGGGFPTKVQSLMRLGIIQLWRARTRGEAFETSMRASMGWWPATINPATGETAPGVRLVPPITQRLTMRCPNGHVVKVVGFQKLLTPQACPTCKTHTTLQNATVERVLSRTKGFEAIGVVAYDDLTSILTWQMEDMASRHAHQEIKGEETALGGRITSGDITLGGNNRSHYGFVQGRAHEMVHNSLSIPYLVLPPIFTALTLETVDEGGLSVVGMKLAGKAKTDEAGAWFGNMLEIGVVTDDEGNTVRRLSLSEFKDEQGRRHLIKHRGSPAMPPYLQDPAGAPWSQVNLGVFFELLDKDVAADAEGMAARFADAPGVQASMGTFGEPEDQQPTPAAGNGAAPATPTAKPAGAPTPGRKAPTPRPRTTAPAAPAEPTQALDAAAAESFAVATTEADVPLPLGEPVGSVADVAPAADATPAPPAAAPAAAAPAAAPAAPRPPAPRPAPARPAASAPVTPAAAPTTSAPATPAAPRPPMAAAPGQRPIAPPPGPRPPAAAPRRPTPAPARPAAGAPDGGA